MSRYSATRVITVDPDLPDPGVLDLAAEILVRKGLVAFATETVYGLGAIATDAEAVGRIFEAKGRPSFNPLIVHVASVDQAGECVADWPVDAGRLADRFWPGPLTIVLGRSSAIAEIVTARRPTVGVRCPAGNVALGLITRCGRPLAAPSANRSNGISPTRAEHVLADLDGRIELILDSGPTTVGLESTVVDLTCNPPRLLRPGPIGIDEIAGALGGRAVSSSVVGALTNRPDSPGQMPVHYAPRTPAFWVDNVRDLPPSGSEGPVAVILVGQADWPDRDTTTEVFALESPAAAARRLYDVLHQCDTLNVRFILVVMPPDRPEWLAVRDRLTRATRALRDIRPDEALLE